MAGVALVGQDRADLGLKERIVSPDRVQKPDRQKEEKERFHDLNDSTTAG
jgi:hypothetical protein